MQLNIFLISSYDSIFKLNVSSKRVSWSEGGFEDPHVLRQAIAIREPNGARTGVLGMKTLLGSHVNTWVIVLRQGFPAL